MRAQLESLKKCDENKARLKYFMNKQRNFSKIIHQIFQSCLVYMTLHLKVLSCALILILRKHNPVIEQEQDSKMLKWTVALK